MKSVINKIFIMQLPELSALKRMSFILVFFFLSGFTSVTAGDTGGLEQTIPGQPLTGSAAGTYSLNANNWTDLNYNTFPVQSTQVGRDIRNVVTFSVNEETDRLIGQDFTAIASVKVEFGASPLSVNTVIHDLTVDYKIGEGVKYNPKQYFHFENAAYVKVTLLSITAPVIGTLDTRDILFINHDMIITRYFELPATVPAPLTFEHVDPPLPPLNPVPDHLTVNFVWNANTGSGISTGNNATQLEWTWIETEAQDNYKVGGVFNNDLIFNNATRVDVDYEKHSYDIPLLYDGTGFLFYRIRAVNIKEGGGRSDGPWNVGIPYTDFPGHNNKLNWQATTTFAENGKRKTVVQYFDGSLRSRQTVTKDNSTDEVITAESFYDGQGRPAIQILPTPGMGHIIQYQQNLNLFNGQIANQDPSEIFDIQPTATPNSLTPGLSTSTGTSKYYSSGNVNAFTTPDRNIPDAEGYPYTYTRYTPDATGRVMSQSGVGPAHKMGTGHETKYYYGGAAAEELFGLFGTEAGNFTHYSKNMVKDANGQISISYVDMHGRTVATALAGEKPANLQKLDIENSDHYPGQAGTNITRDLLDNTTNVVAGTSVESINSLLVPVPMTYQFNYNLNPQILEMAACEGTAPATLCYDCLYDLEISITDESGETDPIVKKFSNVSLTPADDDCTTAIPAFKELPSGAVTNSIQFNQPLPIGSYSIRKTLTISEVSFQHYKDLYMSKALCKSEQDIIDSVYNVLLATSGCGTPVVITCTSCLAELGPEADFRTNYLTTLGITVPFAAASPQVQHEINIAYQQALQHCNMLCSNTSQALPTIREMMLSDMAPYGGQYAAQSYLDNNNTDGSGSHTMHDKYNIFSTVFPATQPFYQHPQNDAGLSDFYYDDFGNIDQSIHPGVTPSLTVLAGTAPQDFVNMFNLGWTKSLLPHHPEYARLKYAEDNLTPAFNFINSMQILDNCPSAGSIYLNPVANDPFFISNPSLATGMSGHMLSYQSMGVSIFELAYGSVRCSNIQDAAARKLCYTTSGITTPPPYAGFTAEENDMAWQTFQGLYAAVRNDYVNNFIASAAPLPAGDEDALVNQHYRLWFPRSNAQMALQNGWSWWPGIFSTPPVLPTGGTSTAAGQYDSQCDSYISTWKTKLLQCNALATSPDKDAILLEITTRMKAVCIAGSDQANPYGASNVAPATPVSVTDRSFEDVIRSVFIQHNILNANGIYTDNYCNPFVIDWPKPYGKGPKLIQALTTQIDSCGCARYAAVKSNAIAHSVDVSNLTAFNQFLLATYEDELTPAMFAALEGHCGGGANDTCICGNLEQIKELYLLLYPYGVSCPAVPADLIISNRAGNTPAEYVASHSITFDPGFESGTNDEFPAYINTAANCNPETACHDNFTIFFNTHYGTGNNSYTWAQIAALYLQTCGKELNVCDGKEARGTSMSGISKGGSAIQNFGVPVNDEPCNAIELTSSSTCTYQTFTNVDASASSVPVPSCSIGVLDADVWFKATIPVGFGSLQIDTKNMGLTDGFMAVYSGSCGSLTEIGCDDNSSFNPSMPKLIVTGAPGTTIWIRVWGFGAETGTFGICVKTGEAIGVPLNDNLCNAAVLTAGTECSFTTFSNRDASIEEGIAEPSCAFGSVSSDVWFKVTLPVATPLLVIDTKSMGFSDGLMAVYTATGTCPSLNLTEVGCSDNDSYNPLMPKVTFTNVAAGTTYYIRFWGSGGEIGSFGICVSTPVAPVNDNCAGAITLNASNNLTCTNATTGTLASATPSIEPPASCSSSGQVTDVWYKFTATTTKHVISLHSFTQGTGIAAYSGTCAGLTQIGCSITGGLELLNLTPGNTYYVRVFGSAAFSFNICVGTIPPQVNCNTSMTPYVLPVPQPLPDFLKCGYDGNAHCISCAGLSTLTGEFKLKFAPASNTAPVFTGTSLSPAQLEYNMNYARFINYCTGFQFSWLEYSQAANTATCNLDNYATNGNANQNVICGTAKPLTEIPGGPPANPCEYVHTMAINIGQNLYQIRKEYLLQQFDAAYKAKCLGVKDIEAFTVSYKTSEYHYTLYYYDLSGNLVKTVPPKGARPDFSTPFTNSVKAAVAAGTNVTNPIPRPHEFVTEYRYNSLNQVTAQKTPDAGESHFWYDALGRLVVSQNAQQFEDNKYSYTLYDKLGRIAEVGQKPQTAMSQLVSTDEEALSKWININGGTKEQITATEYDTPFEPLQDAPTYLTQQNLRNRVARTYTKNLDTDVIPAASTYYSYDVHGNVDKLLQDYNEVTQNTGDNSRYKLMTYDYDLISSKVNMVSYQPGKADAFYHQYQYDAENRITGVKTSRDKIIWETDATYNYFKHGPLARTELGMLRVQGIDYNYTLQGWLKGVNSTGLNGYDPGEDGTLQTTAAKDVFSYALHYYDESVSGQSYLDYKPIGGISPFARPGTGANLLSLYNGNIGGMSVNLSGLQKAAPANTNALPLFYKYRYDQLNRIVGMQAYKGLDENTNQWNAIAINDYKENVSYDPNGNILSYDRNGAPLAGMPELMDQLTYDYIPNTNQLKHVADDPTFTGSYTAANGTTDIDDQANPDNYTYDKIGNMISDDAEGISSIRWNIYGKILEIKKGTESIAYQYDPAGNRIGKIAGGKTTIYVRDASGNVMSVYESEENNEPVQKEIHLYGSNRLGMVTALTVPPEPMAVDVVTGTFNQGGVTMSTFTRGEKIYELSNHLGNVLTTISDKKIQQGQCSRNGNCFVFGYTADILSATDYYPGGMIMPGRKFSRGYRYGFNGKEKVDEISGEGNAYDFDARMYSPRIGRWFSTDAHSKAFSSPYNYVQNNPVNRIDPDGKDDIHFFVITRYFPMNLPCSTGVKSVMASYTTAEFVVIKTNGPDKFYHHKVDKHGDKTTEFYPFDMDKRSGLTKTDVPFAMGFLDRKDRDVHVLSKFYDASPAFKTYLDERRSDPTFKYSENAYNYKEVFDPNRDNFKFWGTVSKYAEIAADVLMIGRASLSLISASNGAAFSMNGGWGVFGKNGLKIGGYRLDLMYMNPTAGESAGTLFSIKQMKQGGSLFRWDYGAIHGATEGAMGFHSTIRFTMNGIKYGSTAQRTFLPSMLKAPFFKPL
jgi:RHS repeat-associated protein